MVLCIVDLSSAASGHPHRVLGHKTQSLIFTSRLIALRLRVNFSEYDRTHIETARRVLRRRRLRLRLLVVVVVVVVVVVGRRGVVYSALECSSSSWQCTANSNSVGSGLFVTPVGSLSQRYALSEPVKQTCS